MVDQEPPAARRRSWTRLVVQGLLSLVLVVAVFYLLRKKVDPAQMLAASPT
jgi:sugar phosphate permease